MATKKVLACSHSRSLQLLRTAGGNQFRPDAGSEFESRQRGGEAGRAIGCSHYHIYHDFH